MIFKKRFSLRVSILTIYVSTFIILISTLIIATSISAYKSTLFVSKSLVSAASTAILQELSLQVAPANALSKLTQSLLEKELITTQEMVDHTLYIAKNLPNQRLSHPIRLTGWADEHGNSIATSREMDGTYSTLIMMPNASPPVYIRLYRDLADNIIKREIISIDYQYDPRTRPWYMAAKQAKKLIWTDAYLSYPYKNPSIASAIPVYDKQGKLLGGYLK